MNFQPTLRGEFVELRPLQNEDYIGGINTGVQDIFVTYAPPKKSFVYKIENMLWECASEFNRK